MPLTITAAGPEDHADWQSLFRAYAAFYKTDDATGAAARPSQVCSGVRR